MLLGGALKEPFTSYENLLPNNRAWATRINYTNKENQLNSVTECTALDNGWVWNIPLWSRVGTGYVYSDEYI
jgi:tryptophan halogenase